MVMAVASVAGILATLLFAGGALVMTHRSDPFDLRLAISLSLLAALAAAVAVVATVLALIDHPQMQDLCVGAGGAIIGATLYILVAWVRNKIKESNPN